MCGLPNDNGKIVGGLETEVILQIFFKNLGFNNFKTNLVPLWSYGTFPEAGKNVKRNKRQNFFY